MISETQRILSIGDHRQYDHKDIADELRYMKTRPKAWFSYIVIHRNSSPIYYERSLKKKMISETQRILSTVDHRQ